MSMNIIAPVAAAALIFASAVSAEGDTYNDTGWYVGGGLGSASTEADNNTFSQDESSSSFLAYGGYDFTDMFGLESAVISTGDVANNRANLDDAGFFAITFTPRFSYRINENFSLYGKAGVALLAYFEEYNNSIPFQRDDDISWSGVVPTFGFGAQFDIYRHFKLRLSYDTMSGDLDDNEDDYTNTVQDIDAEVEVVSLGLHYDF